MIIKHNDFEIRNVSEFELEDVFQVYKNCEDFLALGPVSKASMEMVQEDLKLSHKEGGIFCGIYKERKMIGILDFVPKSFNGIPEHAFISLLMISLPYRKKGLGTEVVHAVEKEIRKNPLITAILSGVQVNNTMAIEFWVKLGYKIISEPELLDDGTTVFRLKKDIMPDSLC